MEEDSISKPFSPNKIVEIDDGYAIILELPESDPLFDKKKYLLHGKGFNVKEKLQLESSSSPNSVATTLDKALQMARIVHLDEVELYFGEFDDCSLVERCSPRNELEALNSLLQPIKSLLSGKRCMEVDFLQPLYDAIVDRIQESAYKNKLESRIDKRYNCEKEKCLVEWGEKNGAKTKLEIAGIDGAGRGAIATKDLQIGEIALEIPTSIIISEELVLKSDMYQILEKTDGISSETMLLLWSMKERHNHNSKFKIYFDTLPEQFNTGLSFGVDAIMTLDGTLLLEEIMQAKEHLRGQYNELVPALCNSYPDIFPLELYSWENFLWACELWYSNSMKVMYPDGKLRTCLIPIAGLLNHSLYPQIVHYGKVDVTTNTLKFPVSRPCSAGEQCCLSYGNLSSSHLITFYGFLPQGDNPYDIIPLDIDVGETACIEDCPMSSWSTHMVRGTWFAKNQKIFYYGLPCPLLDYLRSARSSISGTKSVTKSNIEIEMEVLEDLLSTFNSMMENLTDTDVAERETASWDVKLALEFRALQNRIISSILASCDAGLMLLQNELSKCEFEESAQQCAASKHDASPSA